VPKRRSSGPLTPGQLAELAEKSLHSAVVLISDAMDLFDHGSSPHAYAAAVLAGEEFGKCQLAVGTIGRTDADGAYWKDFWSSFYNHGPKLAYAARIAAPYVAEGLIDAFIEFLGRALQEQRREAGIYVNVVDGAIVTPGDEISEDEARKAIETLAPVIDLYDRMFKESGLAAAMLSGRPNAERMRAALESRDLNEVRRVWEETTGAPPTDYHLATIEDSWRDE
jgi:AbiV family abortive infection protein